MATGTITESNLKRLILEETDKAYISRETTTFFDYLFNFDNSIGDTVQKLEEVATKSHDRKLTLVESLPSDLSLLSELSAAQRRAAAGFKKGMQGAGSFTKLPGGPASFPTADIRGADAYRRRSGLINKFAQKYGAQTAKARRGLMKAKLRTNASKARGLVSRVRGGISRIARTLGRPISYIAKIIKRAVGAMAKSVSGLGKRTAATRIGAFLVKRFAWLGPVSGPLLGIIGAALTAYTIYQIGAAAWNYIFPKVALATTDPAALALMRAKTIAHAAKHGRYLAGDWDKWPFAVQCAFCKANPKRQKPHVKLNTPVSVGPTCAEIKEKCEKVPTPEPAPTPTPTPGPTPTPTPSGSSKCRINTRLVKRNPDLGPNVKAGYKELKKLLKAAGFGSGLDNSGKCDKKLVAAIRAFQKSAFPGQKGEHDGLYGPKTAAKLKAKLTGAAAKADSASTKANPDGSMQGSFGKRFPDKKKSSDKK